MKIEQYAPLPSFLWERLTSFETSYPGKTWQDLYDATRLLHEQCPTEVFDTPPRLYLDLAQQRSGLLFRSAATDTLYFVFHEIS